MKRFSFLHNRIFEVSPAADALNRFIIRARLARRTIYRSILLAG